MLHAPGLFDLSDHLARLSATGDPLEALGRSEELTFIFYNVPSFCQERTYVWLSGTYG